MTGPFPWLAGIYETIKGIDTGVAKIRPRFNVSFILCFSSRKLLLVSVQKRISVDGSKKQRI